MKTIFGGFENRLTDNSIGIFKKNIHCNELIFKNI